MTKGKVLVVMLLPLAAAFGGMTGATAQEAATALDRLRADDDAAGKLKEVDLDQVKTEIAAPAPVVTSERPVVGPASFVETSAAPVGEIARDNLGLEIDQHLRQLDACGAARAAGATAGPDQMLLRFTIQADGRTSNTQVAQDVVTDLEALKCVRKLMDAWQFSPPAGGAIVVEQMYPLGAAARAER